ncbi:predicted protein [Sclerotinia sclerotiorum 1980 UF-70]|uniref:Uncharacterized protein n=1 Tax=Sclerotinia sclerotiorum (strain ATCC 18683 / 1980 / Ss-1) TaxID=665079 RepID=A7EM96_SCLS1|nr:predicted protein [Sclerotinia sclerotiorum 1980 UF-70]EDO03962.1 predicted protein [Sclerotinia sclerotiorum 1980 UF-70]
MHGKICDDFLEALWCKTMGPQMRVNYVLLSYSRDPSLKIRNYPKVLRQYKHHILKLFTNSEGTYITSLYLGLCIEGSENSVSRFSPATIADLPGWHFASRLNHSLSRTSYSAI